MEYILSRRPDFIAIARKGDFLPAVSSLYEHPEFKANYRWDERIQIYRRIEQAPRH